MSYRLFIRPNPVDADLFHFEWALYSMTGQQQSLGESFSLEEIEQVLQQNNIDEVKVVGLVPSQFLLSTSVDIPGKQLRVVRQALPYVVEEQIAEDIHHQHLTLGDKLSSGLYQVSVISRETFQPFFDVFTSTNQKIEHVTADAALLGISDTDYVACMDSEHILFKNVDGSVVRLSSHNFSMYLDALLDSDLENQKESEPKTLKFFLKEKEKQNNAIFLAELEQKSGLKIQYEQHQLGSAFELLCESWYQNADHGVNLCQGDFQTNQQGESPLAKWKAVAVIAGVWFILQVGLSVGQGIYYQKQADYYSAVALKTYKTLFPSDRTVTSQGIERRLKGKLREVSQAGNQLGFLELLGEAGYQYSKLPNKGSIQFDSLNYSDQRGDLAIGLNVDSFEQLNRYKSGLDASGLSTKIASAVQEKGRVRGRISVSGG